MSLLEKLPNWFETKPLVLLRFEDGYYSALYATRKAKAKADKVVLAV